MISGGTISGIPISGAPVVTLPSDQFAWRPIYPDRVYAKTSVSSAAQLFVTGLSPLFIPNNVLGAWFPTMPVHVYPQTSVRAGSQRTLVQNVSPIINPAPPTELTWQPTYPAQIPRGTLPTAARTAYVSGAPFLGSDQRARAIYPDVVRRPTRRLGWQTFEIGGVLGVPKTGGWRPIYPARLPRARRSADGQTVWIVDATTLLNAAPCVELGDESLTNPILAEETLINPTVGSETLTQPTLGSEDLC